MFVSILKLLDTLALLRWNIPDRRRELRMNCGINRPMLDLGARWVLAEEVVVLPVLRWPDRSRDEPAAAVRADVAKHTFNARRAEGTFISADARLERVWRQSLVAVFAGRAKF